MPKSVKFHKGRGLTIPLYVKKRLSTSLRKKLSRDAYGIRFNGYLNGSAIKVAYMKGKVDLGSIYRLADFDGSHDAMFEQAISDVEALRIKHPNSKNGNYDPNKGVSYIETKRGSFYNVSYYCSKKKRCIQRFYCGGISTLSPSRIQHAKLTALHFRDIYCKSKDPTVFDANKIKGWQHKKIYQNDEFNMWA